MSKETIGAERCPCGQLIQFMEQHIEHCQPAKDRRAVLLAHREGGHGAAMKVVTEIGLRNAKTAAMVAHGPVHDQKISQGKFRRG